MQLNNSTPALVQFYIRLASGQEIGPYGSYQQAQLSAATMPVVEGIAPTIFPKTAAGTDVLLG